MRAGATAVLLCVKTEAVVQAQGSDHDHPAAGGHGHKLLLHLLLDGLLRAKYFFSRLCSDSPYHRQQLDDLALLVRTRNGEPYLWS